MHEKVEMSYSVSLVLYNVLSQILYKEVTDEQGNVTVVERELPFRLKYRIGRNIVPIQRDVVQFNHGKMALLATYGELTPDGKDVVLKEDSKDEYREGLEKLLATKVTHTVVRLEPEDIDLIKEPLDISYDSIKVFIGFMMNEPELLKDINIFPEFQEN